MTNSNNTSEVDKLHRFSFTDIPVRGQWVRLQHSLTQAHAAKSYPHAVKQFLNEMFAAVSMFADNLKFQGAVALQSKGNGKLIRTLAECREQSFLRGIAHLDDEGQEPTGVELTQWLGEGQLALSLIPPADSQQTPYQGMVALTEGALSRNLENYLLNSEQLPSQLFFAHTGNSVTGLLLQRLPISDAAPEVEAAHADDAWQTISTLAATLTQQELAELPPEQLLTRLFSEFTCRLHPPRSLSYRCSCSRDKSDRTLRILGEQELNELLAELGEISVDCEFCGIRYAYDAVDIGALLAGGPASSEAGSNPQPPVH